MKSANVNQQSKTVHPFLWIVIAIAVYSLIYFVYTWPLVLNFSTNLPGKADADIYSSIWDSFMTGQTLSHMLYIHTNLVFSPLGVGPTFMDTSVPLMSLFTMQFDNTVLGFNIWLFICLILAAVGGFLLCSRFVSNRGFCLIAGFIYAFSPWMMARIEVHYSLVQVFIVPFYIWSLLEAFNFEKSLLAIKSYKKLVIWLLMVILAIAGNKVVAVVLFFLTIIYFIWFKCQWLSRIKWTHQIAILLTFVIAGHFIIQGLKANFDAKGAFWWGPDFLGLVIPWHHMWIADLFPQNLIDAIHKRGIESVTYLGLSFILVTLLAWIVGRKIQLPKDLQALSVVGLIMLLLTMPEVSVHNQDLFYNPLSFFHFIPGLNFFRCPGRFIMVVYLLLAIGAFYKLEQLNLKKGIFIPVIFVALFIEYLPAKVQTLDLSQIPKAYQVVKKTEGEHLLPLPFGIKDGYRGAGDFKKEELWYQTHHRKNLISGYAPISKKVWNYYHQDTVMNTLLKIQRKQEMAILQFSDEQKRSFFKAFKPDIVLIKPAYRETKAAQIIKNITKGRVLRKREIGGYLLMKLNSTKE